MQIPEARWIVYGTILICTVLIAVYVSFYFRNLAVGKSNEESTDLLSRFREMRDKGQLQESEYLKLKQSISCDAVYESTGASHPSLDNLTADEKTKFMTLAEAESKKLETDPRERTDENGQTKETE